MNAISEHALIGCVLCEEKAIVEAVNAGVSVEWFEDRDAKCIWLWVVGEFSKAKGVDLMALGAACHGQVLPAFPNWVHGAYQSAISEHTGYYIKQVKNDWIKRKAIAIMGNWSKAIENSEDACEDVLGVAERLRHLTDTQSGTTAPLADIAASLVAKWKNPDDRTGLRWPISKLEDGVGAVTDELVFIAAAESVGKSAFALQWSVSLAWGGHCTALRSLESRTDKVVQRMISTVGQVNTWRLRRGNGSPEEMEKAERACKSIAEIQSKVRVNDAPASIDQLTAWGRIEKSRGAEMLIIDNMKHIRPTQKYDSPVQQFRDISQRLKWMRDDVQLPVVVLHHTNDHGDVSWSKDIRRDVDILIVMSIDEDQTTKPCPENGWCGKTVVTFDVQKNREGARGFSVSQNFHGDTQTFEDEIIAQMDGKDPDGLTGEV